jgi:hypothetical protein
MAAEAGMRIVRYAGLPWEDRVNVDGFPCRAGRYYEDRVNNIFFVHVHFPTAAVEPRHVHSATHATVVLQGRAIIDGLTLGPLDVILGPGGEPHGPLAYPDGCVLFSATQGDVFHSEVQELATEKRYRLVESAKIPWQASNSTGCECKKLIDHGAGRLVLEAMRISAGAQIAAQERAAFQAWLVVEGSAVIEGQTLERWDLAYVPEAGSHGAVSFPGTATLLAVTMP